MFQKLYPKLACVALFALICGGWTVVGAFAKQPERATVATVHRTAQRSCCSAALLYCPLSDTVNEGCCCDYVHGQWVCRHTGAVLAECCCIPIDE
jgi:hypothetical protein